MSSDKRLTVDDLSPDQREVYGSVLEWSFCWAHHPPSANPAPSEILTVGGLAGTGKTTLLGVFAAQTTLLTAYVTFTGRASSILGRKLKAAGAPTTDKLCPTAGMRERGTDSKYYDFSLTRHTGPAFCGTIHRLLYRPVIDSKTEELTGWVKRDVLDRDYDLIVIDEASMVGGEMLVDLKRHGVPILAVGDHGQLPPVMDTGELMKNPMLKLEKIHRQALGNPIIELAHAVRNTGRLQRVRMDDRVEFGPKADVAKVLEWASGLAGAVVAPNPLDVGILCWTNRTRVQLNAMTRKALGFTGRPKAGEVVICLKNKPPIYNGMRGLLTGDSAEGFRPWHLQATIEFPDEAITSSGFTLCAPQFCREKTYASVDELKERGIDVRSMSEGGNLFDFGYAMTVHKSQGSQFEHAIFYVDRPVRPDDEDWRRFAYTAVTRASERLTVLL